MVHGTEGVRLGSVPCCAEPCLEGGAKRTVCPKKFHVQNTQGRKRSSGRENRHDLGTVLQRAMNCLHPLTYGPVPATKLHCLKAVLGGSLVPWIELRCF